VHGNNARNTCAPRRETAEVVGVIEMGVYEADLFPSDQIDQGAHDRPCGTTVSHQSQFDQWNAHSGHLFSQSTPLAQRANDRLKLYRVQQPKVAEQQILSTAHRQADEDVENALGNHSII
jgi:hypothetical protein